MWTLQSPPKLPLFFNGKENWPNKEENEAMSSEMSDSYPVLIYEKC